MPRPESNVPASVSAPRHDEQQPASRRTFLLMGLAVLVTGCGPQKTTSTLPGPTWRPRPRIDPLPPAEPHERYVSKTPDHSVIPRRSWATGTPTHGRMKPMSGVRYITVHHDGMSPFYDMDDRATRSRIDAIRRFHHDQQRWGDIGYHYVIDRSGRIWEGRPIQYQGAHVANHNENNLGVLLLGNFDQQSPSSAQIDSLNRYLGTLMHEHRVPQNRIYTHREWETARTICPGHTLQQYMDRVRRSGMLG